MPSAAASEVISTGRKRRWPERTSASTSSTPSASNCCTKSSMRMPFLATMPTPMIAPRNETMFSVMPVIHKRGDGSEHGEDRAKDNRHRLVERAEFNQQHGEHEQDGGEQNHHEVAEGFLLLLVKAAVFDRAGRQPFVLAQLVLNFLHRAAEVAAFEPGGDDDVLPQIVANQFHFARLLASRRRLDSAARPRRWRRAAAVRATRRCD